LTAKYFENLGVVERLPRKILKRVGDFTMKRDGLYYLMGVNMIAYVKTKGLQEVDIEYTNDGKVKYWFENTIAFDNAVKDFKKDKLIQDYTSCQIDIKNKIIELRDENGKQ
jgi:vacuolar-type H+-ATPase subunit C/Vma6